LIMKAIEEARRYSTSKLQLLRQTVAKLVPPNEMIFINGSFARKEASEGSDVDFYIVTRSDNLSPGWADDAKSAIEKIVPVSPAEDGAFYHVEQLDTLLKNIGGAHDNNHNITRRMLLLLEGEWLFNEAGLKDIRRKILERYITDSITDHQLALFLLNDIVRYYRTMAVDYEFKTVETEEAKPWAIRNIKLIFSRKLLYASGLFSVATTAERTQSQKISELERLFDLTVIDRMEAICGPRSRAMLESYNYFLSKLGEPSVREHLKSLHKDQRQHDVIFRELKNEGHHFTRELLKLFESTFDSTHPIRRAIIF
jgi:predicted nucleotidyltransferase